MPLIPNTGSFTTSWDTTDYSLTAGVFVEGFADPTFAPADWQRSMNQILKLVGKDKIVIVAELPGRLDRPGDAALLPGQLSAGPRRPQLPRLFRRGAARVVPGVGRRSRRAGDDGAVVADLAASGAYEREFANGWAVVNPTASAATLTFPASARLVMPQGGGAVDTTGAEPGAVTYGSAASVTLQPSTAAIVLK